jgi:hypothetical protein
VRFVHQIEKEERKGSSREETKLKFCSFQAYYLGYWIAKLDENLKNQIKGYERRRPPLLFSASSVEDSLKKWLSCVPEPKRAEVGKELKNLMDRINKEISKNNFEGAESLCDVLREEVGHSILYETGF